MSRRPTAPPRAPAPMDPGLPFLGNLRDVLDIAVTQKRKAQKRKAPSLDKQIGWVTEVADAWRNMVAYYGQAELYDSYRLPEAEVEALKKQYDDLEALFMNINFDVREGKLQLRKLQSIDDAKDFVRDQLSGEQKKIVRFARGSYNEDDFFN